MSDAEGRGSVLIPTGIEMKSYGCIRSLGGHGVRTVVASDYGAIPHFASRYCDERVEIPSHREDLVAYKDALLEVAAREDVKTVVPVRECDTYVFAKYRDEFAAHVDILSPSMESLAKAHDRLRLAEEAEAAGVPHVDARPLSDVDTLDRDAVIKSRYNILTSEYVDGYAPGACEEVNSVRFLPAGERPDREAVRAEMHHDPVVQDFVPQAKKHLYCALWEDGEPVATYQHRQLRQVSWVGGGGVYRESVHCEAVDRHASDLLSRLDWEGFACIEYLKDAETGEWKFIEINPRVWHSLPEAVRAGVDFPLYYWRRARGDGAPVDADYDDGITCHTSYGEIKHLLSVLHDESPFVDPPSFARTAWEIASSCVTDPRFDYIRGDDPRFVLSAVRALSGIGVGNKYGGGADAPTDSSAGVSTADPQVRSPADR